MKVCSTCQRRLRITSFYTHFAMADGHLGKCKECVRRRVSKHRAKNLERIQAYDRSRGQDPKRKADVKARAHLYKKDKAAWLKQRRREHPEIMAAHNAVARAKRAGIIVPKPCRKCGTNKDVQGHHSDYGQKLKITWLCPACHGAEHRKLNEQARRNA